MGRSHRVRREGAQDLFPGLIGQRGLVMLAAENDRHSSVDLPFLNLPAAGQSRRDRR
jgi:hypothetical protein